MLTLTKANLQNFFIKGYDLVSDQEVEELSQDFVENFFGTDKLTNIMTLTDFDDARAHTQFAQTFGRNLTWDDDSAEEILTNAIETKVGYHAKAANGVTVNDFQAYEIDGELHDSERGTIPCGKLRVELATLPNGVKVAWRTAFVVDDPHHQLSETALIDEMMIKTEDVDAFFTYAWSDIKDSALK